MRPSFHDLAGKLGDALSRDYHSRAERHLTWVKNPLAVLVEAMIASSLCGLFLNPRGFILAFGLAAILAVGIVWPWLSLRGLSGSLAFDKARAREGETVTVQLVVRNRCPWDVWGLSIRGVTGEGPDGGPHHGHEAALTHAAGWRTTESRWEFVPGCRGEYPSSPPRVASGFPFGLWQASRPLAVSKNLLVWPLSFAVGPIPEAASGRSADGMAPRNKPGTWGDVLGVRPYRRGDTLRRIHWPQTARHGQLVVCEVQAGAVPWVQIVLDAHPAVHAGAGPDGSREWAIRVAASFAESWIGQGAEIDMVFDNQVVRARGGTTQARRILVLDALARIARSDALALADLLESPACRQFAGGLRVIVTTDLSLRRLPARTSSVPRELFVMLDAHAFGGDPGRGEVAPLPVTPWIRIDDPGRVPQLLRQAWKEVPIGR